MQIVTGINIEESTQKKVLENSVVTIGNFDGVHRGHAEIFKHLKQQSIERNLPAVVVTFEPHPLKVLSPDSAPLMITTFDQKTALIEEAGIDYLVVVPFSLTFSQLPASGFVRDILCVSLGMKHIIIGHDYAFGKNREGTFETLEKLGIEYGFTLEDLPPIGENEFVFSSSMVRSAVSDGDMAMAATVLGRYYQISGTVVHGRDIGHTLGFPTANIATSNELVPADGVYAVMAMVDGKLVKGACNIGCNPTFGAIIRTIEVFLIDFSECIYEHNITLQFIQKLRPVQKFADIAALKDAISHDVANSRAVLSNLNRNYLHS